LALLLACLAVRWGSSGKQPQAGTVLAANDRQFWFKGNIHTHTLWSDGDDYPEMVALWYKERGYHFLCFTDHNTLHNTERWIDLSNNKGGPEAYEKLKSRFPKGWVEERTTARGVRQVRLKRFSEVEQLLAETGKFLPIQGEEISDKLGRRPVHMNASNLQVAVPPMGGETVYEIMQRITDAVEAQRERSGRPMLVHLNHPNFGFGVTAEDLMRVRGENFFEVYNGHPSVDNDGTAQRASTERMWDIILTRRITELGLPLMYGLAVDDGHNYHGIPSRQSEPGRGWIVVLATELSTRALFQAMELGRFYASSGVALKRVVSTPERVELEVATEPGVEYTIEFIGTRHGFDPASEEVLDEQGAPLKDQLGSLWPATRRYRASIGQVLKTVKGAKAAYQFAGDEIYVRARVTSSRRHPNPSAPGEFERAWVQPSKGPAAQAYSL
jgi:hypothetical protein